MATQKQVNRFISTIVPIAQILCVDREKWILPSVCVAQACCESAYGTSKVMVEANGLFGFKVGKGARYGTAWKGKSYNTKTKEFYGQYVTITDAFRAYDTIYEAVEDYMDLLCTLPRYSAAVCETDARKCITAIKNGGYATSPTYINTIMGIVEKYNLTQYDGVVTGTPIHLGHSTVKYGNRNEDVTYLQQRLTAKGYGVGAIDGIFGFKTLEAVKAFQAENCLAVDGIVGKKTWAALG